MAHALTPPLAPGRAPCHAASAAEATPSGATTHTGPGMARERVEEPVVGRPGVAEEAHGEGLGRRRLDADRAPEGLLRAAVRLELVAAHEEPALAQQPARAAREPGKEEVPRERREARVRRGQRVAALHPRLGAQVFEVDPAGVAASPRPSPRRRPRACRSRRSRPPRRRCPRRASAPRGGQRRTSTPVDDLRVPRRHPSRDGASRAP